MITLVNPTLPYGFAKRHGVILLDAGEIALVGLREGADPAALVETRRALGRTASEHMLEDGFVAAHHLRHGKKRLHPFPGVFPKGQPLVLVGQQRGDIFAQGFGIARRAEQARLIRDDQIRDAANGRGRHRQPHGHGFEQHVGQPFAHRGQGHNRGLLEKRTRVG